MSRRYGSPFMNMPFSSPSRSYSSSRLPPGCVCVGCPCNIDASSTSALGVCHSRRPDGRRTGVEVVLHTESGKGERGKRRDKPRTEIEILRSWNSWQTSKLKRTSGRFGFISSRQRQTNPTIGLDGTSLIGSRLGYQFRFDRAILFRTFSPWIQVQLQRPS